ncbi:YneF family protein [Schleiferilactobacillus perolens]|nr:YneF family protein [Schleiferilactobacillus perolens]MCI1893080.1 YneF family protein [Schleiferilactobacillus harbinensis]MCI1911742.1 YneF family protein [Schleiferilactobacillus harbinensis]MCI2172312.1 YneF family protein [Schleiferilactobacillus perolens]
MAMWLAVLLIILGIIGGAVLGFFGARRYMKNYFRDNPPVNEDMLRSMMMQMGQKPSEKKLHQMLAAMRQQEDTK